jgi:hypothetical protein
LCLRWVYKKVDNSIFNELRTAFKSFLDKEYPELKDRGTILSDAFYPYRTDIGISFAEIFANDCSLEYCHELLKKNFTNKKRKNPKSDSSIYMRAIRLFKKYLDSIETTDAPHTVLKSSSPIPYDLHIKPRLDVPRPCNEEVNKYLKRWDSLENYRLQENALDKLFFNTCPKNVDMDDVLIKVSTLNAFYSTNIFSPFHVAKRIIELQIDPRLEAGDCSLVNDVSVVKMEKGIIKRFYSFSTKYCSHHRPYEFPIYDSFVDEMLRHFRDNDRFDKFTSDSLRNYPDFKSILLQFRKFYELEQFNLKEIDKYLWQLGKDTFPRKY